MSDILLKKITIDSTPLIIQNGSVSITNSQNSYDTLSGSLILGGGLGINCTVDALSSTSGGAITVGGGISALKKIIGGSDIIMDSSNSIFRIGGISSDRLLLDTTSNKQLLISPDGITTKFLLNDTSLTLYSTSASINSTTGSFVINGGMSINCSTDSISITNGGALTINGGVGIAKKIIVGNGIVSTNTNTIGSIITSTNGNVGINTIPTCSLDVIGNLKVSANITASNLYINTGLNIGSKFYTGFNDFSITNGSIFVISEETSPMGYTFLQSSSGNYVSIVVNENVFNIVSSDSSGNVSSNLYINDNGRIGINTTSPSYLFDINGIINSVLYTGGNISISNTISSNSLNISNIVTTNKLFSNDLTSGNVFSTNITTSSIKTTDLLSSNITSNNLYVNSIISNNITTTSLLSTNITSSNLNTNIHTNTNQLSTNISSTSLHTSIINASNFANFTFDSNTLGSIITTNGNVGIGKIPDDTIKLDINGSLQCNNSVSFINSSGNFSNYGSTILYQTTDSTGLSNGSLHIAGGISIFKNVYIGGETFFENTTPSTSYSDGALHISGGLTISCNENSVNVGNGGALTIQGGTSIGGDLFIGGQINGSGSSSSTFAYLTLTATDESVNLTSGTLVSFGGITIQCTTNSTSVSNGGALLVAGGSSVSGDLYIGGKSNFYNLTNYNTNTNENIVIYNNTIKRYSIDCNTSSKDFSLARYDTNGDFLSTVFQIDYSNGKITFSNTSPSISVSNSALTVNGGISIGSTNNASSLSNGGGITIQGGSSINKNLLVGGDTKIFSTTVSNNVSTGAFIVNGGVAIGGNCNILGDSVINGNLTVNGVTTTIVSNNTSIGDNILVLNSGPTGTKDAGIITQRYQQDNDVGSGDVVNDTNYVIDSLPLQTGMTSTQIKLSNLSSSSDDFYNGWWIKIASGFSNNQVRKILSYSGSSHIATLSSEWTNQNPSITDIVYLYNKPFVGFVFNEISDRFEFGSTVNDPGQSNVVFTDNLPLYLSKLTCSSTTPSSNSSTGTLLLNGGISISETSDASSNTNGGTITTNGGASIGKKLYVGTELFVNNTNLTPNAEDIFKTISFTASNNQNSFSDITGLLFSSDVWGFDVYLSARLTATTNMNTNFHIRGVNKITSWEITKVYVGNDSGIEFNITNSGQLQYTSLNYAGFTSLVFKFRAIVN